MSALLVAACSAGTQPGTPPPPPPDGVGRVEVTPANPTVASGGTVTLSATVVGRSGQPLAGRTVTWSSSSTGLATVSSAGVVTAALVLGGLPGMVTITATADGISGSTLLSVTPVPAAAIVLNPRDVLLATGDTRPLTVEVKAASGTALTGRSVTWTSSDPGVATVNATGLVTTVGPGTARIRADVEGRSDSVTVTSVSTATYSVPTALTAKTYPWSYRAPTTVAGEVNPNPCALDLERLAVPRSYLGRHPLPEATGAPFAPGLVRGMGLKDVWQRNNPSFVDGCSGSARTEFVKTLDRLKALGVDYINLVPWTFLSITNGNWTVMEPGDVGSSILDDVDFEWAVQQARNRGIKVHWTNQIQGGFEDGKETVPAGTRDNVIKFFDAVEPYLLRRAAFLQQNGVDVMSVNCVCWTFLEAPALADLYEQRMATLLPKIRAVFKGQLRMKAHPSILSSAAIRNSIDLIELTFGFGAHGIRDEDMSMNLLKSRYRTALQGEAGIYAPSGKPVILDIEGASRAGFLTTGYLEETFCVASFGAIFGGQGACIQRDQQTDFSIQAMVIQAQFEVVREQTQLNVWGVEVNDYWMVDQLLPSSTFPNLAMSPRNKPAEGLIRLWFQR